MPVRAESPASLVERVPAETTATAPEPARRQAPLVARELTRAVVLGYHDIGTPPNRRTVTPSRFKRHMKVLAANGVTVVKLSELIEFLEGTRLLPARVAVLTFDDGDNRMATHAVPVLEELGFPYTLALPTASVTFAGRARKRHHPSRIFDWQGVKELIATGLCETASHGHLHDSLKNHNPVIRDREIIHSRTVLASHVGTPPQAFVFPMGYLYPTSSADLAAAGYRAGLTITKAAVVFDTDPYRIPRLMVEGSMTEKVLEKMLRGVGVLGPMKVPTMLDLAKRWRPKALPKPTRAPRVEAAPHRIPR